MATQSKFFADIGLETGQDLLVDGNATVTGNLTVNGTQTTVNSTTTSVADSMIELANSNTSSDTLDIGIYGNYNDGLADGVGEFTGLFRDASDSTWKLFDGLEVEPTTTVNTSGTNYAKAALEVGDLSCTTLTATNSLTGASLTYPTSDGTNGQVLTTNGSGTLSFSTISGYTDSDVESYLNTSTIYTDATNDRLGVGQSSPNAKLDVVLSGAGDIAKFTGTSITDFDIIGNPPEFNLEDSGSTSGQKRARITLNDEAVKIQGLSDDDSNVTYNFLNCDLSNGRVGIGTTSASHNLHVKDNSGDASFRVEGASNSYKGTVLVSSISSGDAGIQYDANINEFHQFSYGNMRFHVGTGNLSGAYPANERMQIKGNDGTVMINRTSSFGAANSAAMIVTGSGKASCAFWTAPNTSGYDIHTFFNGGLGVIGTIEQNSSLNGVAYNTSSDYRLKENVNDNWDATTILKQLRPVEYNFISDTNDTYQQGFIAHELAEHLPFAVSGEKDAVIPAVLYQETDQEVIDGSASVGDIKEEERIKPQQVDYSKVVALLVKTIQELEARIATLESA